MTLISRLEAAERGSRELDEAIATVIYGSPEKVVLPGGKVSENPCWRYPNGMLGSLVPPWTTSLDSALTLVSEVVAGR